MRTLLLTACLLGLSTLAEASSTLRCGSQLISLGDDASEVLRKCGEPTERVFIGYRERQDEWGFFQEVAVEEWTLGPRNGMYHFLRFEGNRLTRIQSRRGE